MVQEHRKTCEKNSQKNWKLSFQDMRSVVDNTEFSLSAEQYQYDCKILF